MPDTPQARRYTIEELKFLADSPLVQKPDGLPPIEEWMGPPPPQRPVTQRAPQMPPRGELSRTRTDGDILTNGEDGGTKSMGLNRRPSLFETRLNSRNQISEDIILGPPKLSFASASTRGKMAFDFDTPLTSAGLSSPATLDDDHTSSPRFDRFRMQSRDKDREKSGLGDRSDLRTPSRRTFNKDEPDGNGEGIRSGSWTSQRQQHRKSFGAEDGDRFRRGNSEVQKDRPQRYENFGRDRDRPMRTKRDESSWILDDGGGRDRDNNNSNHRLDRDGDTRGSRDFRSFNRDRDHRRNDDDRNQRVEKDPEWLDAEPEDGQTDSKAHSMEEFQRWKARMKASQAAEEKKPKSPVEEKSSKEEEEQAPATPLKEKPQEPEKVEPALTTPAPIIAENGVDRFFTLWSAPVDAKSPEQTPGSEQRPLIGRSSRFTSFFSPQEQPAPSSRPTEQHQQSRFQPSPQPQGQMSNPPQHSPNTQGDTATNEDKEGFRRILQMLGGSGGQGGLSLGGPPSNPSPPVPSTLPPMQFSQPKPSPSPAGVPSAHQPPPPQHQPYTSSQPSPSPLQNLQMPGRDANADFLLGLMRQSQHAPQGPPPLPSLNNHSYGGPSQMPPPPQISTSPQAFQRPAKSVPQTPMYEDPAIAGIRQRPNQEPISMLQQRGPPPSMEQHQLPNWLSQAQQQPQGPGLPQGPGPQGPGLQQGPNIQQSHGGPGGLQGLIGRQLAPPPGFARPGPGMPQHGPLPPVSHGPPPFMGPPPPGPNISPLPFQMNPMPPNFPPGGPPPPPFFGMNGPPPYSMPFHHEGGPIIGLPGPHFGFPHEALKNPQHPKQGKY